MREGGVDWKERGEKGTLALHCFKKRHICHHSDSFALLGLRREEGETTTNAAWRSHLLAVFPDLVEREKGKGEVPGAHASVRAVRVPEEPAFMAAAAYVSALRPTPSAFTVAKHVPFRHGPPSSFRVDLGFPFLPSRRCRPRRKVLALLAKNAFNRFYRKPLY